MTDDKRLGKTRSYTVAALLGIFVAAVLLAVISRMLPGRLSGLLRSSLADGKDEE
jgi:hypothetical protein